MNNFEIYDACRSVPPEAMKQITAGRLRGMTDINPMWRIKKMTEIFGPCGEGWGFEPKGREFVPGANDTIAVFVDILLWYKKGDEICFIPGTGGSMFVAKESSGLHTSDEAVKMATTDAIGVACKYLGIGADVYWDKDKTKYDSNKAKKEGKEPDRAVYDEIISLCSPEQIEALVKQYKVKTLFDIPKAKADNILKQLRERNA